MGVLANTVNKFTDTKSYKIVLNGWVVGRASEIQISQDTQYSYSGEGIVEISVPEAQHLTFAAEQAMLTGQAQAIAAAPVVNPSPWATTASKNPTYPTGASTNPKREVQVEVVMRDIELTDGPKLCYQESAKGNSRWVYWYEQHQHTDECGKYGMKAKGGGKPVSDLSQLALLTKFVSGETVEFGKFSEAIQHAIKHSPVMVVAPMNATDTVKLERQVGI